MIFWFALLALNYFSWALLCLATPRAYRQHFGSDLPRTRRYALRAAGTLAALVACASSIHRDGWDIGSVNATAAWMLAAVAWVLLNTYRPRLARFLALAAPLALLFTLAAPAAVALVQLSPTVFFGKS